MSGVIPRDQTVTHAAVLDPRGFTLMEVLIAMAILALALPILLGLRNWDLNLQSRAADITAATMLAQEKLIEAELSPVYPVGETTGDFRNPPPGYQVPGDVAERAPRYRWKRIITTTPLTARGSASAACRHASAEMECPTRIPGLRFSMPTWTRQRAASAARPANV